MILRSPCSVTEPPHVRGSQPTQHAGVHRRQERSPSPALLLPFSNLHFSPSASLALPSTIRMTFLLPMAANSFLWSHNTPLQCGWNFIAKYKKKKKKLKIKQSYKGGSHHPQSKTISWSKAAFSTCDAQRHKSSCLNKDMALQYSWSLSGTKGANSRFSSPAEGIPTFPLCL